jgi:hypothetical protein
MSILNRPGGLSVLAALFVCFPAWAQPGVCRQQSLRGVYCLTCNGFTDLSKYNPAVPKGTLVPVSMLARMVIDTSGKGTGEGMASLAGNVFPFQKEEKFTVNPDCTADKTYTLKNPANGSTESGKAKSIFLPKEGEIHSLILEPGDIVTCVHKIMHDSTSDSAEQ